MKGSSRPSDTARSSFINRLDTREVSDSQRREQLAESIRTCREELTDLLGISGKVSDYRDWTQVQKEIHRRLLQITDPNRKQRAEELIEKLMDAEEELIEGNLRLVLMVVRRYARGNMGALEEMDFVQEGCEGLLDAVRRFDFVGGTGFLTYAVIRIRKRVLMAMEKQQRLVRMPSHAVKKTLYLKEVIDEFAGSQGRFPSAAEIETVTGGSVDWPLILSLTEKVLPLHAPIGESGIPLAEQIPGSIPPPEETGLNDILEEALSRLDKRSKFVLVMRYGLMDGEAQTLASVSSILGLSIERTRQIEKAAIKLLRDSFSGYCITDWLQG